MRKRLFSIITASVIAVVSVFAVFICSDFSGKTELMANGAVSSDIISVAQCEIGICDDNVYHVKYIDWYRNGDTNYGVLPWCQIWVSWVFNQVGELSSIGEGNSPMSPTVKTGLKAVHGTSL